MTRNRHPGEVLAEDFMKSHGLTVHQLAEAINVPARQVWDLTHQHKVMTVDLAARLGRYFDNGAQFWLDLQAEYDKQEP